jgi:O-antigen/teichoic acid export membrane protein
MPGDSIFERLQALFRSYLTSAGKRAAWNLSALVALTGLTQAAALGTVLVITHALGPAGFGVFMFALLLQPYLYLLGTLGTSLILFRDGVRDAGHLDEITTAYQVVGLVGSLVITVLTCGAAWLAPISGAELGLMWLIAVGNVATCLAIAPLFDVHHRQPLAGAVALVAELGMLVAVLALAQTGKLGLVSLGAVLAVKWWSMTAAQYVLYRLAIRPFRLVFSFKRAGRMLVSSLPLAGSTLIATLPASAGVFFVRLLHSEAEAGIFAIASQVVGAFLVFSNLAIRILQPHIAGHYGLEAHFLRKLVLFTSLFLSFLCAGGFAAGAVVILFLLTPDFHTALLPLAVLLCAALLLCVGTLASSYLVVLHQERTVLCANVAATITYVAGVFLLVPSFGNLGAATASASAASCGTLWMLAAVRGSLSSARANVNLTQDLDPPLPHRCISAAGESVL